MAPIQSLFDDPRHFPNAQHSGLLLVQQQAHARASYLQQQNDARRSHARMLDQADAARYFYEAMQAKPRQVEIQSMTGLAVIQPAPAQTEPKPHSPKIETKRWGLMPRFARRPKAVAI